MTNASPTDAARTGLRNSAYATLLMLIFTVASILFLDTVAIAFFAGLEPGLLHRIEQQLAIYVNPYTIGGAAAGLVLWRIYLAAEKRSLNLEYLLTDRVLIHLLGIFAALLFTLLLKAGLGRARPELLLLENTSGFFGFQTERQFHSLPSAHMASMTAVFMAIYYYNKDAITLIATAAIVLFGGLGRLLALEHHPADLIAGAWAGWLMLYWADLFWKSGMIEDQILKDSH